MARWGCVIGDVDREQLPEGADSPLRRAVEAAYLELTGKDADFCSSGWGGRPSEFGEPPVGSETDRGEARGVPDTPEEAWRGQEPAEGTRRRLVRDAAIEALVDFAPTGEGLEAMPVYDAQLALRIADDVEAALLAVEPAQSVPVYAEDEIAELDIDAVTARLQSLSDLERGQLMEKVGGAAGIVGSLVRQAAEQLEGFPAEVKVPALLLLAAGIADQAGPTA